MPKKYSVKLPIRRELRLNKERGEFVATMKGIAGVKARKDQLSSLTSVFVGDVEQKSKNTVSAKQD